MEKINDHSNRDLLKEKIILSANNAFRQQGIKKVTMDEIASSLKISKRTLYEIFKDKETLLKAIIIYNHRKNKELMEKVYRDSSNVLEVILTFFEKSIIYLKQTNKNVFSDLKKYPNTHRLVLENRARETKNKIAFYKQGVEQGLFRQDVNFEILTLLMNEQLDLLLNTDVCNKYTFVEIFESITFTFIRGITTDKGAKLLDEFIIKYREKNERELIKQNK